MFTEFIKYLNSLPKELLVLLTGALPVSELRGAIPLGLSLGLPLAKTFWLAILGNLSFVVPALFLFSPVSNYLRKLKIWSGFFDWIFERARKNAAAIQKYETFGLFLFVAIPLPMTGAWSGVIAATLLKVKFRYAFLAIFSGVLCAAVIVSLLCVLGVLSWKAVAS